MAKGKTKSRRPSKSLTERASLLLSATVAGFAGGASALPVPDPAFIAASTPVSPPGPAATYVAGATTGTVTQNTDRVVLDWTSFDIASGETVAFEMQSPDWIALNRVLNSGAASSIDGVLQSTLTPSGAVGGHIWIVNPNGVAFGPNAVVDMGGLLASTARPDITQFVGTQLTDVSGLEFLGPNAGAVTITSGAQITAQGGVIAFIAPSIAAAGTVIATNPAGDVGQVLYGSTESFTIRYATDPSSPGGWDLLTYTVYAGGAGALSHTGATSAGQVMFSGSNSVPGGVMNLSGVVDATAAVATDTGVIIFNNDGFSPFSLLASPPGSVNLTSAAVDSNGLALSTSGNVRITGGNLSLGPIDAGGDVWMFNAGSLNINGAVNAGGALFSSKSTGVPNVDTFINADISANADIFIESLRDVNVQAGRTIRAYANGTGPFNPVGINMAVSRSLVMNPGSTLASGSATSLLGQIIVNAGGDVTIANVSGGDLRVSATRNAANTFGGAIATTGGISVSGDAALSVAPFNLSVTAGDTSITIGGDISAGRTVTFSSGGGSGSTTGFDVIVQPGATIRADADGDGAGAMFFNSRTGINVMGILAAGAVGAPGSSLVSLASNHTGFTALTTALGGPINIGAVTARDLRVDAIGAINAQGVIDASGTVIISGPAVAAVSLGQTTAGGDINVGTQAGDLTVVGPIAAGGRVTFATGGAPSDVVIDGNVTANNGIFVNSNRNVDVAAGRILVASGGFFGDVRVGAVGTVSLDQTTASGNVIVTQNGGLTVTGPIVAGGRVQFATPNVIPSAANVVIDGDVTANNDVFIHSNNDIIIAAGRTLRGDADSNGAGTTYAVDLHALRSIDMAAGSTLASGAIASPFGIVSVLPGLDPNVGGNATIANVQAVDFFATIRRNAADTFGGTVTTAGNISLTGQTNISAEPANTATTSGATQFNLGGTITAAGRVALHSSGGNIVMAPGTTVRGDADGDGDPGLPAGLRSVDITARNTIDLGAGSLFTGTVAGPASGDVQVGTGSLGFSALAAPLGGPITLGAVTARNLDVDAVGGAGRAGRVDFDGAVTLGGNLEATAEGGMFVDAPIISVGGIVALEADDIAIASTVSADTVDLMTSSSGSQPRDMIIGGPGAATDTNANALTLTQSEFDRISATRLIAHSTSVSPLGPLGEPGPPNSGDVVVRDLTINGAAVRDVILFAARDSAVRVVGNLRPGATGPALLAFGLSPELVTLADSLGFNASGAINNVLPDRIVVTGGIGSATQSFARVSFDAFGDILLGTDAFINAVTQNPLLDPLSLAQGFGGASAGQLWTAGADVSFATDGAVLMQTTGSGRDGTGLVAQLPQAGGLLRAGREGAPSRVELFGVVSVSGDVRSGAAAAQAPGVLDSAAPASNSFRFNGCVIGPAGACSVIVTPPPIVPPDSPGQQPASPPLQEILSPIESLTESLSEAVDQSSTSASTFMSPILAAAGDREDEELLNTSAVTGSGDIERWDRPITPDQGGPQ